MHDLEAEDPAKASVQFDVLNTPTDQRQKNLDEDLAELPYVNALRTDWNTVLPADECSYIMGNPPFVGSKFLDKAQREEMAVGSSICSGCMKSWSRRWRRG